MKKIMELIKPYLSLIFGVLFFLLFLNSLRLNGETFATGVVAVVISSYYLCAGVLGIVLGDKLPILMRKVFSILSVSLFPIFMFVFYLLQIIGNSTSMGPSAWVIYPLCMGASLAVVTFYVISRFVKSSIFVRLTALFAAIFVAALVATILFDVNGNQETFATIGVVELIIYSIFAFLLFNSLSKEKSE